MGTSAAGAVVLVRFPFSDLSQTKLRPAIVLADAGRGDSVLCQVTSKPYGDDRAVRLDAQDLTGGALSVTSFVRPGKLFTANHDLITKEIGALQPDTLSRVVDAVVSLLRAGK